MSGHTQENTTSRAARNHSNVANAANTGNGASPATTATVTDLGSAKIEIAGMEITLPIKFGLGHVLTENQAKVLDAAYQRQFTNNQNALAKSRAEALSKATTDAERAAKAPLTATAIAALYADYEPAVGGAPRQSAIEKMRAEAAWRFWTSHVQEHNKSVQSGGAPIIVKAGKGLASLPTGKGAVEKRAALIAALLTLPAYADGIQTQLDAVMAERGTKADKPAENTVLLSAADLL